MPASNDNPPGSARDFHTTHWSLVLAARGDASSARSPLAALCRSYWYPLYAFVRRQGISPHDAQDLTQEFFARLLEKDWLNAVERERGRFRSWLLAAMKHFLINEWDKSRAKKRGGGIAFVSIDDMTAESRYEHEPADLATADLLYDRRWALTLLDRVLARLREEFVGAGKAAHFDALKGTLTGDRTPYADIATALGTSEGAVKVAVHRLRERYRDLIRTEIAETVATPSEVEEELRHLLAVLSG
ncbi:MAG: RNA polymerase sigma factor [Chthoniobacteraceae bacterium]